MTMLVQVLMQTMGDGGVHDTFYKLNIDIYTTILKPTSLSYSWNIVSKWGSFSLHDFNNLQL
jgi:hypothetical protein